MAKKNDNNKLHQTYYKALRALGKNVTERQRTTTYQKIWKNIRKEYQKQGQTPPNLYATAREYIEIDIEASQADSAHETPPAHEDLDEQSAQRVIDEFIANVNRVYQNTLRYIADNKDGTGHEGGKLASIADFRRSEIDEQYYEILSLISQLEFHSNKVIVAQAIADNKELDYDIAISLVPPSDIVMEFEETISMLLGIMAQIDARAEELAEQAEREYYGQ